MGEGRPLPAAHPEVHHRAAFDVASRVRRVNDARSEVRASGVLLEHDVRLAEWLDILEQGLEVLELHVRRVVVSRLSFVIVRVRRVLLRSVGVGS